MAAVPGRVATLLDPEQHATALEREAIASLARNDLAEAFRHADRRCRILPVAQARHYTLRADIIYRRGFQTEALADIAKALELAPDDLAANRRLMQWGDDDQRDIAARRLLRLDRDPAALEEIVARLRTGGETAAGALHRIGDSMTGWAIWQGQEALILRISTDANATIYPIASDPQHLLARTAEHAASFKIPFPMSNARRVVDLELGTRNIAHSVYPAPTGNGQTKPIATVAGSRADRTGRLSTQITVIVPVYDDFEATRRCLQSLTAAIAREPWIHVLLVDDATPDKRIAIMLDELATRANVDLIRNAHNLGFIGTINRALDVIQTGDVILLNADTVVPTGFATRLCEAAYSAADIGTVTPLSNNGEATSLPRSFTINAMLPLEDIVRVDAIAARVNAGRLIDMPDGIGFCLYVKRSCLDKVGGLSDHYHRGYLEDVDLCLRARQHGFRNVCATSVYVGHAGSASFKADKRALVVLNLARLRLRFPEYRDESASFKTLDPLKPSRGAIEREFIAGRRGTTIVFSGTGATAEIAKHFATGLAGSALIANVNRSSTIFSLRDAGDGFPQSLDFELPAERADLIGVIKSIAPVRAVIADPTNIPTALVRELIDEGTTLDLLLADGGICCRGGGLDREGNLCPSLLNGGECACNDTAESGLTALTPDGRILLPDTAAEGFLRGQLDLQFGAHDVLANEPELLQRIERPAIVRPRGETLGLLPIAWAAHDFAFMRNVIQRFRQARAQTRIVVLGETINDLALLALGNVAVTGPISSQELPVQAALHDLGRLFVAHRAPLFGHPLMSAAFNRVDVPLAFFDWSFGNVDVRDADLQIAPSSDLTAIVTSLLGWSARS